MGFLISPKDVVDFVRTLEDYGIVRQGKIPLERWIRDGRNWVSEQSGDRSETRPMGEKEGDIPGIYFGVEDVPTDVRSLEKLVTQFIDAICEVGFFVRSGKTRRSR